MGRIRDLIREYNKQITYSVNSVENSILITVDRLLINEEGMAELPKFAIGDIVWNKALIFESPDTNIIIKEVTVSTDGYYAIFDTSDDVINKYCTITYLAHEVD